MKRFWVFTGTDALGFQLGMLRIWQRVLLLIPALAEFGTGSHKVMSFLRAWRYLFMARVEGDYLEFGVFEGLSFALSMRAAARYFPKRVSTSPRFFAFDSFSGLPSTDAVRDPVFFRPGDYSGSLTRFRRRIRGPARGWEVIEVPGYYEQSLTPSVRETHRMQRAAFVTIDCDLYDSTLVALRFITPLLQNGTVLYFDDWYFSRGDRRLGEMGACEDWLAEQPGIQLLDFGDVGTMGKSFIVRLTPSA